MVQFLWPHIIRTEAPNEKCKTAVGYWLFAISTIPIWSKWKGLLCSIIPPYCLMNLTAAQLSVGIFFCFLNFWLKYCTASKWRVEAHLHHIKCRTKHRKVLFSHLNMLFLIFNLVFWKWKDYLPFLVLEQSVKKTTTLLIYYIFALKTYKGMSELW